MIFKKTDQSVSEQEELLTLDDLVYFVQGPMKGGIKRVAQLSVHVAIPVLQALFVPVCSFSIVTPSPLREMRKAWVSNVTPIQMRCFHSLKGKSF